MSFKPQTILQQAAQVLLTLAFIVTLILLLPARSVGWFSRDISAHVPPSCQLRPALV